MNAVGLGELEHGEELRLGDPRETVVAELGHHVGVGATENRGGVQFRGFLK